MTLSEAMKLYRRKNLITQRELAELCGVATLTINLLENNKQQASEITKGKIYRVIGEIQSGGTEK